MKTDRKDWRIFNYLAFAHEEEGQAFGDTCKAIRLFLNELEAINGKPKAFR